MDGLSLQKPEQLLALFPYGHSPYNIVVVQHTANPIFIERAPALHNLQAQTCLMRLHAGLELKRWGPVKF